MTKYFKRSFKHNKPQSNDNSNPTTSTNHCNTSLSDKHKHKQQNDSDKGNEITNSTHTPKIRLAEPENNKEHYDLDSSDSILDSFSDSEWLSRGNKINEVELSNTKYTANFLAKISNSKTIFLFDRSTTISSMSKACFEKLDLKPKLTHTHTYKVNSANGNSLSPPQHNYLYPEIPQEIPATVYSLQTSTSTYYLGIRFFTQLPDWYWLVLTPNNYIYTKDLNPS